jgi:hypothetical protein
VQQTQQRSEQEIAEIERHKYLLSEQAGHDVGWEFAEKDWLANHAPKVMLETTSKSGVGSLLKKFFRRKS